MAYENILPVNDGSEIELKIELKIDPDKDRMEQIIQSIKGTSGGDVISINGLTCGNAKKTFKTNL